MSAALQSSVSPDSAFELPPPTNVVPSFQAYPDYPAPANVDGSSSGWDTTRWSRAPSQIVGGVKSGLGGMALASVLGFTIGAVYSAINPSPCGPYDKYCGLEPVWVGFYGAFLGGSAAFPVGVGIGVSREAPRSHPSRTPLPAILGAGLGMAGGVGLSTAMESPQSGPFTLLVGTSVGALVMDRAFARTNTSPRLTAGYLRPGLPGARISMAF